MDNLVALFSWQKSIIVTLSETVIESQRTYDYNGLYEIPGFSFIKRNRKKGQVAELLYISLIMSFVTTAKILKIQKLSAHG